MTLVRRIPIFVFLLCTLAFSSSSLDACVDSAMVSLVNQDYDRARGFLDSALTLDNDNIDALYMRVTVEQTQLLDYESYETFGDAFIQLSDSILQVLERKKGRDAVKILFYIGNIYGGKSIIKAKTGSWMGAVSDALTSVSHLKKVKSKDPDFYAAYLGVGVFNYYLSQNLKWVPFLGDKSQEGLRDIEKATRARFPFNYAANNTLAWILIDRQEFGKADSVVSEVLGSFPNNTIFLRIKTRIALWTGKYAKAIETGKKLYTLSHKRKPVNWSDFLSGYQIVAESYEKLGDYSSCYRTAVEALSYTVPPPFDRINYVKQHTEYLKRRREKYKNHEKK